MSKPYQLAFTLHGHSSDVRNLCVPNSDVPLLLSASRDGSAIVWGPSSSGTDWDAKARVEELERRYVSCVAMVRSEGQAYLLIGSSSGMLSSYQLPSLADGPPALDAPTLSPQHTIIEHSQNLCCIDTSPAGLIVTGSWDKSVIVWKSFKKAVVIEGHQQAVWAVKFVGEDRVLTASADKTITLHAIDVVNGKTTPLQTYTGHTEPVRGLSLCPDGQGFWSCGNDGLVNVYSFDRPAPERTLSGHTSFVYSVSAFPDGSGAVSSGEDGALRVWSNTDLVQTINHPSMSLWSSAVVPAGDSTFYVASASADSAIRFFTREDRLMASQSEREVWNNEVAQRKLDKSQVGDVKKTDLPGMEALARPGHKDGQVIMIKNKDDNVEAYKWSAAETTWEQIGQVVDAVGSGRKQLYEGKEYDYVFDVDVSEGMPPLKLPYNVTENPWVAAQKFLDRNELPSGYAEQVVDFIQKNTGGVQLGAGGGQDFADPFTGGSRYTGGGVQTGGQGGYSDPFTGGSRYTGGGVQPGSSASYGGADPLTGSSSYQTAPPPSGPTILPVRTYLSFKKINAAAARGKIDQFNDEIKASDPSLAMDDSIAASLNEAIRIVSTDAMAKSEKYDPAALLSLALAWDEAHRFPLVDVLRALALQSPALGAVASAPSDLLKAGGWGQPWVASKPRTTNQLLAIRALANLFSTMSGRKTVAAAAEAGLITHLQKGRRWAEVGSAKQPLATVALNYSILALEGVLPASRAGAVLSLVVYILSNETEDNETIYRAAVAFGNLLSSPVKGSLGVGDVQRGKEFVAARARSLNEKRLTDLSAEVQGLGA